MGRAWLIFGGENLISHDVRNNTLINNLRSLMVFRCWISSSAERTWAWTWDSWEALTALCVVASRVSFTAWWSLAIKQNVLKINKTQYENQLKKIDFLYDFNCYSHIHREYKDHYAKVKCEKTLKFSVVKYLIRYIRNGFWNDVLQLTTKFKLGIVAAC